MKTLVTRILMVNAIHANVEVESRHPHLGLAYLAAMARRELAGENLEFRIVEGNPEAVVKSFRPHLACISSVSQNYNLALNYTALFASQGVPVILGGIHVSLLPGTLPKTALAACLGEGEQTFVEILRGFLKDGLTASRPAIAGIAYWQGDSLQFTPSRPFLAELDRLPFPARDLLPIRPHTYMFTSRGCPYRCTFCASSHYWDTVRFFSADYVVEEIELLVKRYGARMISFFDDLFAANKPRLHQIVHLLVKRRLAGRVNFTMNCRANIVDAELANLLRRMGVASVGLGLESGDEETLRYLKGPSASVAKNMAAIEHLKKAGISVNASFVIGSPRETRTQIQKTYDFIRRSRLDLFDVYLLTPFPGTPVWAYAKNRGLVDDQMEDWSKLDVNIYRFPENAIILSETLAREELLALYKAFRRLRLRRNLTHVWNHPLRRSLPRMALQLTSEYFGRLIRKR